MADEADSHSNEEWRDIPGWEGFYQASSAGRIRSVPRTKRHKAKSGFWFDMPLKGRVLRQYPNQKGYLMVTLSNLRVSAHPKPNRVNRLVCLAFHGVPLDEEREAAHNDGNRLNNCPTNLRWATHTENLADVVTHRAQRLAIGG